MKNNKWYVVGMAVLALVFALELSGCGEPDGAGDDSYTFKFRVDNNSSKTITKIEFFNGSNKSNRVLDKVSALNLANGEMSNEYKVSGFTEEYEENKRLCGVMVTFEDESTVFGYWNSTHESKILVTAKYSYWEGYHIDFSAGQW
jgi:hypothetical protein